MTEAPLWLLLPCALLAWSAYVGVVLAERRQHPPLDHVAEHREGDHHPADPEQDADESEERFIGHPGMVTLPPGIPSILERLDPRTVEQIVRQS